MPKPTESPAIISVSDYNHHLRVWKNCTEIGLDINQDTLMFLSEDRKRVVVKGGCWILEQETETTEPTIVEP